MYRGSFRIDEIVIGPGGLQLTKSDEVFTE
jgi:hypothetical protein